MAFYQHLFNLLLVNLFVIGISLSEKSVVRQQVNLLKDLMVALHKIHNFDNIIIYRTPRNLSEKPLDYILILKDHNHGEYLQDQIVYKGVDNILAEHIHSPQLYKPMMTFTISPWDYVNNTEAIPNLGNILTNKNLAVVILNDIFNIELKEFVALSLGACLETKIVFLLVGHELTNVLDFVRLEKLMRFFRWCWSKNILNVILLFQKNHAENNLEDLKLEAYTYTPFPLPFKIIQLTEQHPREYFKDRTSNLFGYKFITPVLSDKPVVFKFVDPFTGVETVTGIAGKIYMEYVQYINATFKELKSKNVNVSLIIGMDYIYDLLIAHNIDISIHPMTALTPNKFFTSYPISNSNCCVVAPVKQELFPGLYIPRTFPLEMWILLAIIFLTFQITFMFINYDNYGFMRPWLAFSTTLRGLLNMPVSSMGPHATITLNGVSIKRKIFVHMLLLLTGMIYCIGYIAALSSFLSSTLYPEQIESLEDLLAANISIMMVDYIYKAYNYLDLIPNHLNHHQLIIAGAETVSYHLNRLDTRYAYNVYYEEWKAIQGLQMHLSKPRFKIVSKLCIPNIYLNLPMQFNSPFYHSFKEYTLRAQTAGLYNKWSDMIYWQIQKANGLNGSVFENIQGTVPIGLEHLTYILYIYVGGIILATVAFVIELKLPYLSIRLNKTKIFNKIKLQMFGNE